MRVLMISTIERQPDNGWFASCMNVIQQLDGKISLIRLDPSDFLFPNQISAELVKHPNSLVIAHGAAALGLVSVAGRSLGPLAVGAILVKPFDCAISRKDFCFNSYMLSVPTAPLGCKALVVPLVPRTDPRYGRSRVHAAMWEAAFLSDAVDPETPISGTVNDFLRQSFNQRMHLATSLQSKLTAQPGGRAHLYAV